MAYGKRYKRTGRRRMYKRAPKRATVNTLQRQVRTLQKKTRQITENDTFIVTESSDIISPYFARNLSNYSGWLRMWPSTGTNISTIRSKMYHKSLTIDNLITLDNINNEEGTVNFTYYIVSRKSTAASATDTVNSLSLTANVDYRSLDGLTWMNLKKWNVHYVKRFTLTMADTSDADASTMQCRFKAYVKVNKLIENPDGHWIQLENSPDPRDTYYIIIFNDNSTSDLENPIIKFNCVH